MGTRNGSFLLALKINLLLTKHLSPIQHSASSTQYLGNVFQYPGTRSQPGQQEAKGT